MQPARRELPAGAVTLPAAVFSRLVSRHLLPIAPAGQPDAGATLTSSPEAFPPGPSHRPYTEAIRGHRVLLVPVLSPSHGGRRHRPSARTWPLAACSPAPAPGDLGM